jgi:hypothetical protein
VRQDCKTETVCVGAVPLGGGRVNGEESKRIGLMGFIYCMKYNNETSCNCFKWGRKRVAGDSWWGGNLINVQCKTIQNCHNESSLYNEYILIKS